MSGPSGAVTTQLAALLAAALGLCAGAALADAPAVTVTPDALAVPSPPPPPLDVDAALPDAAASLQPYHAYRVDAFDPAADLAFAPPAALRAVLPEAPALVSGAVAAFGPQPADRNTPHSVDGALSVAAPPAQSWRLKADLDVKAGDRADPTLAWPGAAAPASAQTSWRRLAGGIGAGLNLSPGAALDLSMSQALEVQDLPERAAGQPAQNAHQEQQAVLALDVTPASVLHLGLSARAAAIDDLMGEPDDAAASMDLRTTETTAGFSGAWTPVAGLRLEAGDRVGYAAATWRETDAAAEAYAISEPSVAAMLKPWTGAQWRLSFGHAVSPLDLGAFAMAAQGLQRAADLDAGVRLSPNQEWRTQAEVRQTLPGDAALAVTLTDARLDTTQELARSVDGTDLPVSLTGGERRQLDLSLSAPLSLVALNGFTLQTAAAMRDSQITDPVTGAARRLSGEAPYDATLTLAQDLAPLAMRWGVMGRAQAAQVYYTPEQTSTAAAAQSLGMFVEYHPQPFALRLQVDGLAGGSRDITDALYDGSRDSDRIVRIDHRLDGGPAFSLVLRKAL